MCTRMGATVGDNLHPASVVCKSKLIALRDVVIAMREVVTQCGLLTLRQNSRYVHNKDGAINEVQRSRTLFTVMSTSYQMMLPLSAVAS